MLDGIDAAAAAGFTSLKLDTVVIRGVNDEELVPLLEYAKGRGAELRFIEYMDVGGATRWTTDAVVSRREMLERIEAHYGPVLPLDEQSSAPADRFLLADGTTFGIISSTTEPFCASCDRSRLTADGVWLLCLYAATGTDLRRPLRAGASPEDLPAAHRGGLVRPRRPRRRRTPRHGSADDAHTDSVAEKRCAPRDAHTGRMIT